VLYRDKGPRDMAVAALAPGGTWQRRGVAGAFGWNFDGCPHVGGGLAFTSTGAHALVWTGAEGRVGVYVGASTDEGRTWTAPVALGSAGARHGDLAASGDVLAAAWDDSAGRVLAATAPSGRWGPARAVSADTARASHPRLAALPGGAFLVVWTERTEEEPTRWSSARVGGS
jgi:hypothetical protein